MNKRIDYLDDPAAPPANSIVPSVNVAITDDQGRLLVIRRTDNGNWALPGGGIDAGESVAQAAVREVEEETGIRCEVVALVGIYSNPHHVIHYTSNDEVRQEFSIVLTANALSADRQISDESSDVEWVAPDTLLAELDLHPSMRERIEHFLAGPAQWPHIS